MDGRMDEEAKRRKKQDWQLKNHTPRRCASSLDPFPQSTKKWDFGRPQRRGIRDHDSPVEHSRSSRRPQCNFAALPAPKAPAGPGLGSERKPHPKGPGGQRNQSGIDCERGQPSMEIKGRIQIPKHGTLILICRARTRTKEQELKPHALNYTQCLITCPGLRFDERDPSSAKSS
ncbi:hypothetical protein MAPG_01705 [Magnaporthiopsis poae ATCC 64411]|uniref:Uncharacterized protein n=1 Tax=Magnaporthiopsis poae (strain ATCC 64411 / 73-15) TaxID=644358 RepID=A0A0C4DPE1_MAGP6|nr:hypothetical protein MAPG_01705 [Magnaporthiopsis poae ATCC 64411]